MAFQFSLAAVLKYRESLEHRAYLTLERTHQEVARTEAQILQVDDWRRTAAEQRAADLARGVTSIHLQGAYEYELALERYRDLLVGKLKELKVRLQRELKLYETARQERRVLDELRSHKLEAYVRGQNRREQHFLDELFLARRKRD